MYQQALFVKQQCISSKIKLILPWKKQLRKLRVNILDNALTFFFLSLKKYFCGENGSKTIPLILSGNCLKKN